MTDKEIVERAKEAEKRTGFGELVHSLISKGVNSAFGIGFIEGMVEYRNSLQEEPVREEQVTESTKTQHVKETCKENGNSLTQKSETIDFEQELYKYFGQVKDFTLGMRIAKRFYEIGRNHQEPISEDLNTAARKYAGIPEDSPHDLKYCVQDKKAKYDAVLYGANWQKEKLLVKAFDFTKEHNTACVLASECLRNHGWFNRERDFNDLFRHLACVDKLFEGKFSGKTKVIVIKED